MVFYRDTPVICCTNWGYMDFTRNFIKFVQKVPRSWVLQVYCMDVESYEECKHFDGIEAHHVPLEGSSSQMHEWGQIEYKRICYYRYDIIRDLFKSGSKFVIHLDTDVAMLNDPVDFMIDFMTKQNPRAIWAAQCDENRVHCSNNAHCKNLCGGCFIIRNCKTVDAIIAKTAYKNQIERLSSDQEYFNGALDRLRVPKMSLPSHLFLHPPKKTLLDPSKTMVYHFNYMIGPEKKSRMMSEGFWLQDTNIRLKD